MDARLFEDLDTAFKAAESQFIAAGVKPVAFIDRYRGQPLNPHLFEYYELPAVFIQRRMKWERVGRHYNARMVLNFHIVSDPTWDTSNVATNREEGLKYYTFLDQVRYVLDNFKVEYLSTLFRDEDTDEDAEVILYDVLGYTADYYGNSELLPKYESNYDEDTDVDHINRQAKIKITDA